MRIKKLFSSSRKCAKVGISSSEPVDAPVASEPPPLPVDEKSLPQQNTPVPLEANKCVAQDSVLKPAPMLASVKTSNQESGKDLSRQKPGSNEEYVDDISEEQADASALLHAQEIYGQAVMYKLTSSKWSERREAVGSAKAVNEKHTTSLEILCDDRELTPDEREEVRVRFAIVCSILKRFLKDRVAPVCFVAFEAFLSALSGYEPHLLGGEGPASSLSNIVPVLIEKMSGEATGSARRMQTKALFCLMKIANATSLGGLSLILPSLTNKDLPVRPRLALFASILDEFGLKDNKVLKLSAVMAVAVPALQIADDKTRKAAVDVVVAAYAAAGPRVRKHLSTIKPALLQILNREFAAVDGEDFSNEIPERGKRPEEKGRSSTAYLDPIVGRQKTEDQLRAGLTSRGNASSRSSTMVDYERANLKSRGGMTERSRNASSRSSSMVDYERANLKSRGGMTDRSRLKSRGGATAKSNHDRSAKGSSGQTAQVLEIGEAPSGCVETPQIMRLSEAA